jgi:hypothetical protein
LEQADLAPLLLDLAIGIARRLPRPLGEVRSAAAVSASMVRGRPQFGAATPMAGDTASSGLVEELLLGEGLTRLARAAASKAVGAQRWASSAFSSEGWPHCPKVMTVVSVVGGGERLVLREHVGQDGVGARSGGSAPGLRQP